ncbi:ABC transporter permease [Clostridiales bacterium COT073_COT-073]|nr:ABC transporter permease [Clostridiales bacterium COT073_COT-073]
MKTKFKNLNREISVLTALVVMTILFGIINPVFIGSDNLTDIINQSTIYGLMGLGMTFVIVSGGIDLSVGSAFALIGVIVSKLSVAGMPPLVVILTGLLIGFLLGAINGILISNMKLQPFIATMGTMSVFRGIAYVLSKGMPILNVPTQFRNTVDGIIAGNIRISIIIFAFFAIIFHVLLKETKFGNYVYAIGGNEESARLSGVKITFNKIMIYGIGMMGTSMAALVQIGKLGTGEASAAQGYELNAIAAVAIGGASMAGGRGGVVGTVLGAILFSALKVGLIVSGVETFYQYIATGLVIVIAAYIEIIQAKLADKKGMKLVKKEKKL